tara:strand:+ start:38 stop:184 length:147 start_codon:yes stop_codon:yes gene_type:complete
MNNIKTNVDDPNSRLSGLHDLADESFDPNLKREETPSILRSETRERTP